MGIGLGFCCLFRVVDSEWYVKGAVQWNPLCYRIEFLYGLGIGIGVFIFWITLCM